MAEILLSLTIIGVVAAITLPSLTGNINERTWNTQRKALYARMSQAIALMPALNGYGTLTEDENKSVTADTAAETFVTEGLSKVLKINNICDSEHLADCGIPEKITDIKGDEISSIPLTLVGFNDKFNYSLTIVDNGNYSYSQIDTKAVAFETVNGESILVYYNPRCSSEKARVWGSYIQNKMCVNFVYDLNGNKGPNTVGKDIGVMTALYSSDSVLVAPMPAVNPLRDSYALSPTGNDIAANTACTNYDVDYRLPNIEELMSVFYNRKLFYATQNGQFWSASRNTETPSQAWNLAMVTGAIYNDSRTLKLNVWCIKR